MKKIICAVLLFTLLLTLCACKEDTGIYDPNWIIGKTSLEVEERYGEFYQPSILRSSDGLFRNTACHYLLRERPMFFCDVEITLFSIYFNENGIAYEWCTQLGPIGG